MANIIMADPGLVFFLSGRILIQFFFSSLSKDESGSIPLVSVNLAATRVA